MQTGRQVWLVLLSFAVAPSRGGVVPAKWNVSSSAATKDLVAPSELTIKELTDGPSVVRRPEHLEAVPLNRDGSLNLQFHRELLLGEDTSAGKLLAEEKGMRLEGTKGTKELIADMFSRADKNRDGKLSPDELKEQIRANINKHLEEAKSESNDAFQSADSNGDGRVTWDEYKPNFMANNDLVESEHARKHADENHPNDRESESRIGEEKHAFEQGGEGNGLDEIEWLAFRHPEHSRVMLKEMAEEIIAAFDTNKDGRLMLEEFTNANDGPNDVDGDPKMANAYREARQHEFETMIDKDGDGVASVEELLEFVDPKNERHVEEEVQEIMHLADSDKDGTLTLVELMSKSEFLALSGFIHPKNRLHDDL